MTPGGVNTWRMKLGEGKANYTDHIQIELGEVLAAGRCDRWIARPASPNASWSAAKTGDGPLQGDVKCRNGW